MTTDLTDAQFDALLKRLHLANACRAWRELVQRAERDEWSYRDFLALLPSLRTKHLGIDDATSPEASAPPARISGIDRPRFPEPTHGVEP